MNNIMDYKVSIIISTYNRANLVGKTINSFIEQSFPKENYEIVLVDNGSTDQTERIINEIIRTNEKKLSIKYVLEPRLGLHFAKNRGAKEAKNEILYFTDDDILADKDLLVEMLKVFDFASKSGYKVGAATGIILPKFETKPPQWILRHCINYILSLTPRREEELIISSKSMGVFGCHYMIKKEVFFRAGGFNPDVIGKEWIGDGEAGLNIKLRKQNYKFIFTSKSVIYHMIPKERLTQKCLNKRFANQGSADSYTEYKENKYSEKQLYLRVLGYIFKALCFLILAIFLFFIKNSKWHLRLARVFYWINRIKYDFRLIKSSDWRELVLKSDWINE